LLHASAGFKCLGDQAKMPFESRHEPLDLSRPEARGLGQLTPQRVCSPLTARRKEGIAGASDGDRSLDPPGHAVAREGACFACVADRPIQGFGAVHRPSCFDEGVRGLVATATARTEIDGVSVGDSTSRLQTTAASRCSSLTFNVKQPVSASATPTVVKVPPKVASHFTNTLARDPISLRFCLLLK